MCFSAQASFITGVGLLGLGALTIKRVRTRRELPYALIPLLFGIQQLLEGMLWLTFTKSAPALNTWLTYLYLLFANVLWPIYVPLAVLALETVKRRRRIIAGFAAVGAIVSAYLLAILLLQPITASVADQHILYDFANPYEQTTITLYIIVTCVSLLLSSHPRVMVFGMAVFISEVVAYTLYTTWLISVWCFFAAVLSIIVFWHFQGRRPISFTT
ncbi:MAG: DUF6629 family protein [Fluviibacter sp.]